MNNVFVYCEMEGKHVADVSLELLTKGRKLSTQLGCQLETICAEPASLATLSTFNTIL